MAAGKVTANSSWASVEVHWHCLFDDHPIPLGSTEMTCHNHLGHPTPTCAHTCTCIPCSFESHFPFQAER